ncbi:histidinol-phosphatase (PHP family) [Alkalibacillus filiformis]|uniref:Histidinol-phosphatase n=1 Tax=Alkalibacillus filiformis TaxID=200990 RepID=A0ABU0DUS9_9BACI|nr:histidinol-phosphatase HisJ family protein [Alkalibacillus filiformis]MDQ0352186.1 histidinol-phosphatase (PHP family) [Alkalibacillus filiformis]
MFDNHMHSNFSADCEASMEDMIEAGIKSGVKELSFTEHIDYDYPDRSIVFDVDLQRYDEKIKEMQAAYKNKINIRKGIELGLQPHLSERYNQLLNEENFDFIIASMHTTDQKDLHSGNLFEGQTLNEAYEKYYTELYECVRDFDQFSILGHLDLVTRYKYEPGVYHFLDVIEEMFKIIIPRGQGIEINTSGYKYNMNRLLPSRNILQLYYDMGGEIITVGSDAHKPERVGDRIDEGYHLLKDIGFKYVTTFQNREPQFHRL